MVHGFTTRVKTVCCEGIVVTDGRGKKITRTRRSVQLAAVNSCNIVGNHNHNLPNALRAVKERIFTVKQGDNLIPPPLPVPGSFVTMGGFMSKVAGVVGPRRKMTPGQFVAQCHPSKRKLYQNAADDLVREGITHRDARVRSFVKNEKVMFKGAGLRRWDDGIKQMRDVLQSESDPAPRLIQPRSPKYNVALGCYTRAVEHDIYRAIAQVCGTEDDSPVVMKGMDPVQCGNAIRRKWESFHHPVAVGIDASRFDQHVSQEALRCEHSCYNKIFGTSELKWLLNQQLVTHGTIFCDDKRVVYTKEGGRCSGDMNTGLGNCLLMCGLVDSFVNRRFRYHLVNNGDDCVIIMERRCLNRLQGIESFFLDHGFSIKMEDDDNIKTYGETKIGFVDMFERLSFCQSRPVKVVDGWIMVRGPDNAFAKDSYALCEKQDWKKWIAAVGVGGGSLYGDIPICTALYELYRKWGDHSGKITQSLLYQDSGFARMCRGGRCKGGTVVLDVTRNSYGRAFGIPPSHQLRIERYLRSLDLDGPWRVFHEPYHGTGILKEHQYCKMI